MSTTTIVKISPIVDVFYLAPFPILCDISAENRDAFIHSDFRVISTRSRQQAVNNSRGSAIPEARRGEWNEVCGIHIFVVLATFASKGDYASPWPGRGGYIKLQE